MTPQDPNIDMVLLELIQIAAVTTPAVAFAARNLMDILNQDGVPTDEQLNLLYASVPVVHKALQNAIANSTI